MNSIKQEFMNKGITRGGLLLLSSEEAINMIHRCQEQGIVVLGIDGFKLTDYTTQPLMEQSIDLTKADCSNVWTKAESFLAAYIDSELYFEVVID